MVAVVIPTRSERDLLALSSSLPSPVYIVYDAQGEKPSFSGCRVLQGPGKGFAQACNVGLSRAQQDGHSWVLVLNDDAKISEDSILKLVSLCSPKLGAAGPIVYHDGGIESAGIRVQKHGRVSLYKKSPDATIEVDALAGVSMLIPSWARFDKRFIHGFEDIALCFRMREMGYQIVLDPTAVCYHQGGQTIPHRSVQWFLYSMYGQLLFYNRKALFWPIVSLAFLQGVKTRKKESFIGMVEGIRYWKRQENSILFALSGERPRLSFWDNPKRFINRLFDARF